MIPSTTSSEHRRKMSDNFFLSIPQMKTIYFIVCIKTLNFKGTVLRDRFQKCCLKLTDLGLNKSRGWFLNFSETPLIFNRNRSIDLTNIRAPGELQLSVGLLFAQQ